MLRNLDIQPAPGWNRNREGQGMPTHDDRLNRPCAHSVDAGDASIELNVPDHLRASAIRALMGSTPEDLRIDLLPTPSRPLWLALVVFTLRLYRSIRPDWIGNRCVFEPSCSRYSELAFRKHGFSQGLRMTLRRLRRCQPSNGGLDSP